MSEPSTIATELTMLFAATMRGNGGIAFRGQERVERHHEHAARNDQQQGHHDRSERLARNWPMFISPVLVTSALHSWHRNQNTATKAPIASTEIGA